MRAEPQVVLPAHTYVAGAVPFARGGAGRGWWSHFDAASYFILYGTPRSMRYAERRLNSTPRPVARWRAPRLGRHRRGGASRGRWSHSTSLH
jgi:hypothetical protein